MTNLMDRGLKDLPEGTWLDTASPGLVKSINESGKPISGDQMTLVDRLRNPQWVHGPTNFIPPNLDAEQTQQDMGEAATEIERLRTLLTKLSKEVLGSVQMNEPGMRELIGNTNYAVLVERANEARAALVL